MEWKWSKSALIAVWVAIVATWVMMGFSYYSRNHNFNASGQPRKAILQKSSEQNKVSFNASVLFLDYETAVNDYFKTPNQQTLDKMLNTGAKLDDTLNRASDLFGLNVKRWVDLFQVGQYYAEQKIQQVPNNEKQKLWYDNFLGDFLNYQLRISKQIGVSKQDYNNVSRDVLLYGDFGLSKADPKTQERMDTIFNQKASQLLPQAIQDMKDHKGGLNSCMPSMSDLDNPKNMATMVAFIQYQTRYCAFMVQSKTESYCNTIRHLPPIDEKKQMLNESLAVCQIAEKRLQAEKEASIQKYGNLSYKDYFTKYVVPLVPKYTEMLQIQAKDKNFSIMRDACNPQSLPVVDFRDPDIDAQIAAYEIASPNACHAYFESSCNDFERRQALKYSVQTRKQKTQ